MAGLIIVGIVFGTVFVAELPDNSGLANLVLGTRYRPTAVFAGTKFSSNDEQPTDDGAVR